MITCYGLLKYFEGNQTKVDEMGNYVAHIGELNTHKILAVKLEGKRPVR